MARLVRDVDASASLLRALYDCMRSDDPARARLEVERMRRVCRAWREAVRSLFASDDALLGRGIVASAAGFVPRGAPLLFAWSSIGFWLSLARPVAARDIAAAWKLARDLLLRRASLGSSVRLRYGNRRALTFFVAPGDGESGSVDDDLPSERRAYVIAPGVGAQHVHTVRGTFLGAMPSATGEGFFALDLRSYIAERWKK